MTELLTAAQMRAIERAAMDSGAVTGLELMERAGRGVVEAIFEEWPGLAAAPHRAVVLCGPGNNGGDGFVIARLLKDWGWDVDVYLYGDPEKLPPDARTNHARWTSMGTVRPLFESGPIFDDPPDLTVDALFGTGLSRALSSELRAFAEDMNESRPVWYEVAVDIPTGLDADSGRVLGAAFPAELTVTFHAAKVGHVLAQGPDYCGKVVVKDIGLSHG